MLRRLPQSGNHRYLFKGEASCAPQLAGYFENIMIETTANMGLEDYRNVAIIIGVIVALIVYITNSYYQYKQRISENAVRYLDIHSKLFENEFLRNNIKAMEDGDFKRDTADKESEKAFNRLLGEIEHLALLSKNGVISKTANVYMFGWFALHIQPVLTSEERNNIYWELAVKFLDELRDEAEDFYKLSKLKREKEKNISRKGTFSINNNITSKIHTDVKKRRCAMLFASGDFGRWAAERPEC